MIARREDPHPGAQLTFTDARAFVDLLTRWDDWCDEVEQTLTAVRLAVPTGSAASSICPRLSHRRCTARGEHVDHIGEMTGHRPGRGEGAPV